MKKTALNLVLVILPFLGLLDAIYVSYEVFGSRTPICRPPFQCAAFLQNNWAYIAGLPLSFYGAIFYSIVLVLAIINFLKLKNVTYALRKLTLLGFGFALYVTVLMSWVVKAWCLWCLFSVIVLVLLFTCSRFLSKQKSPE